MARTKAVLGSGVRLTDYLSTSLLAHVYPASLIGEQKWPHYFGLSYSRFVSNGVGLKRQLSGRRLKSLKAVIVEWLVSRPKKPIIKKF